MTRIAQTLALLICAPFLWLWAVFMLTLVLLAQTGQGVVKVWR